MPLPPFNEAGDLPPGVHRASLEEVLLRFGQGSRNRKTAAMRLERIYYLAMQTGHLSRFIIFGSFVTDKYEPNDVDVFMLMGDSFDSAAIGPESKLLFDHATAQVRLGSSVFWLRRMATFGGENATIEHWQTKRDGAMRGIVEVVLEALQ